MQDLFRFLLMRPPEKVSSDKGIDLGQDTDFQNQIMTALGGAEPRDLVKAAASDFVKTTDYVDSISKIKPGLALLDVARIAREPGEMSISQIKSAIEDALSSPPETIVRNDQFIKDKARLKDSIVAMKLLRGTHDASFGDIAGNRGYPS